MSRFRMEHSIIDADGPPNPHIKVLGDLNGDGLPDLVVASSADGPLVWYAAPNWEKTVISPTGRWSTDAKLADMNGNGSLDVLISEWYTFGRMEWFENPAPDGDPTRDEWKRRAMGEPRAHDIEAQDIDGDGELEVVTRTQGADGDKIVVRKRVDGEWRNRVLTCPAGEGLAVGDLTGNGRMEAVIGGLWFEAPKRVLEDEWRVHRFAEWTPDAVVALADMNGNGRLDIVLTRSEGPYRLSWFEAPDDPTAGEWTEHVVEPNIDYAHSLTVIDANGDGLLDIVTAEMHQSERKRVAVYLNDGEGGWECQVVARTGSHKLCAADVDGDGCVELIGANWSGSYQPVEMWKLIPED